MPTTTQKAGFSFITHSLDTINAMARSNAVAATVRDVPRFQVTFTDGNVFGTYYDQTEAIHEANSFRSRINVFDLETHCIVYRNYDSPLATME